MSAPINGEPVVSEEPKRKCVLCGREGALALFGIALGLVFIAMSVDIIRRNLKAGKEEIADE